MTRQSGILLHISSLPGKYGCGTLGAEAFRFVDFLHAGGQSLWQILPTCPVDSSGSPYNSCAARAGCITLIDLDRLVHDGYLTRDEVLPLAEVSGYPELIKLKTDILTAVYTRAAGDMAGELRAFFEREKSWLFDYAVFMTQRELCGGKPWYEWETPWREHDASVFEAPDALFAYRVGFYVFCQYLFFTQWDALRGYANARGIRIMGDLPIYVSLDSADVWSNREFFELEEESFLPRRVSGVPPDGFSDDGQKWNNPLYRWDVLQSRHYSWWIDRLRHGLRLYDVLRLDHFRGFEAYWAIGRSAPADQGEWVPGPGMDLFRAVLWQMGNIPVIAEDLGLITQSAAEFRRESGFPGMRVMQFAFDGDFKNPYLPHNYDTHTVAYTGTHDNNTTAGWAQELSPQTRGYVREYLGLAEDQDIAAALLRAVWASAAYLAIAPMQDVLGLGADARMNTPGTVQGNWSWRMTEIPGADTAQELLRMTRMYGR